MAKSPRGLQEPFSFEQVFQEPCGLVLILTILTWCVSRIQSLRTTSCQSCSHNPSNKATVAPVLTGKEVIKTRNKKQDDETGVTYGDVKFMMRRIGLNFDDESIMACTNIDDDYVPQLFTDDEPSLDEVKQAFSVFDVNKDGYLDASDLLRVFQGLGLEEAGMGECEQMIAKYDMNNDRRIDLVEFTKVLEASLF